MSSRDNAVVIVALLAAAPLAAQTVDDMARRVDSTLRAAAVVRDSLDKYRKANPMKLVFDDSIVIGAGRVKVYFNEPVAPLARPGIEEAERHLREMGRALEILPPQIFSIVTDTAVTSYDERLGRVGAVNVRRHHESNPNNPSKTSVESDPKSIANVIVTSVSNYLSWNTGSKVGTWASGGIPLAPDLAPPTDWGALRLAVVSSPSHLGRECYLGGVSACRLFLGLDSVPDPVTGLLDAAGRKTIVGYEIDRSRRASAVATERCLGGNDEACIAVLRITSFSPLASPFLRTALITEALQLGGSRSAERLLMTPGPARGSLAAAAGQPIDSVVASWQRKVSARAGVAGHLPPALAIASVIWIALCFVFALRSSRWR